MKPGRTLSVTRRIFQGLRHDRRTLAMALFAPILSMLVFGTAFSGDVHDLKVIVVNRDQGFVMNGTQAAMMGLDPDRLDFVERVNASTVRVDLAAAIIDGMEEGDVVVVSTSDDWDGAVGQVEDGDSWAAVLFPQNFTSGVMSDVSRITLKADESNVNVASAIKVELNKAIQKVMGEVGVKLPLEVDDSRPVYGEKAEFIDFFVPGIMALAIFLLTTMLTLLSFVGEKTSGTLERLQASPLTEGEIVGGYAMAFGVLGMVQAGLLLVVAALVFNITIVGNPLLAFLVAALLAVVSQNLGILLSSVARNEAQAVQFLPLIIMPTFLLAGIFWPVEAIPRWLQPVSYLIPPTYAVEALRAVLLRGWGLEKIFVELMVLAGFAVLFLAASVLLLRSRKR